MKRLTNIKYLSIAFLLALLFESCEQKATIDPGTLVSQQTIALYQILPPSMSKMANYSYAAPVSITKKDLNEEKEVVYRASLFREATKKITANLKYDKDKIALYNKTFKKNFESFPEELLTYNHTLTIDSGKINSNNGILKIKVTDKLKPGTSYLIPLSIISVSGSVDILKTAQTLYVRVDYSEDIISKSVKITRENCFKIEKNGSIISDIGNVFTMEGLIYVDKFHNNEDPGEAGISTFMGTEGGTLLRFGDSGVPGNHLQAAGSDIGLTFKTKQWYHIALVCNNGKCTAYINGKKIIADYSGASSLDEFYIGRSWNGNRGIEGRLSEIRLWKVARTKEQIAQSMLDVNPKEKDLYAYWKMNMVKNDNQIPDVSGNNRTLIYVSQKDTKSLVKIELKDESGIILKGN